jgi:myo-inositol-1(or 4)-monophosphatase
MNLETICKQVLEVAAQTRQFIFSEVGKISDKNVEVKGSNNYVTYVDKNSEKQIIEGLSKIVPKAGFIAEEGTSSKKSDEYNWVIDPLDGTTNFIHGLPPYAISIALMEKQEVVLGVIVEVSTNECFYTWKNAKSYLNGKEINVTKASKVSDSLIATGFPYTNFSLMPPFMETLNYFFVNSHGVRRLGSAATDLAYVDCGRFEVFYEYGLCPWDVAAGTLLVKNAGGKVTDFKRGNDYIFGKELIASNTLIHDEFSGIITKHFENK